MLLPILFFNIHAFSLPGYGTGPVEVYRISIMFLKIKVAADSAFKIF
jgi:hypothetical protein